MIQLNDFSFQVERKWNRPLIGLKWAQTLDGQLADDLGKSQWISGQEELEYTHLLRAQFDAILVGASTFLKDLSKLTVRTPNLPENFCQPVRVILDPRNRVIEAIRNRDAKVLSSLEQDFGRPTILLHTAKGEEGHFESIGYQVYTLDISESFKTDLGIASLANVAREKLQRPIRKLMVEGGSITLKSFLLRNLVDVACVGIAPLITGGTQHRIQLMSDLQQGHRLRHHATYVAGQDTVIEMVSQEIAL